MDDSFRQVLPYLRPRTGDMGWLAALAAGILLAVALGAIAAYLYAVWRSRVRTRNAFCRAALERRLSKRQVRLLLDLARQHKMHDPLLLLTSLKAFDRYVGQLAARIGLAADERLDLLAAARRRLGFDTPDLHQRFFSTRTLSPGQMLAIWPHGADEGFLRVVVVHRDEQAISAAPLLRNDDRRLSSLATGDRVKVRFWRKGDTEYRFRTDILEAVEHTTTIRIRHAEQLERVQLRDYYRVPTHFEVVLYALPVGVEQIKAEGVAALATARLVAVAGDVSGGGLSVHTGEPVPRLSEVVIDPEFDGPFPLAGVHCLVGDQQQRHGQWRVRLQYVDDLPKEVRDELVAAVFAHEVSRSAR